ncbi:31-O-demethyl-FK506 methyltransferase FkbM [Chlorella vulgaris]
MAATAAAATAAAPPLATARLPTGLLVRCVSKRDVPFLYREIYERRCYLSHGITLPRGGTVIDCGANIGLFSMQAAQELGSKGLVLACEPLPFTFAALQHNVAAHSEWWSSQQQQAQRQQAQQQQVQTQPAPPTDPDLAAAEAEPGVRAPQPVEHQQQQLQQQHAAASLLAAAAAPIVALQAGLGSGEQASADFTFYPRAAGWSSMLPAEGEVQADMQAFLEQALSSPLAAAAAGLDPPTAALGCWLQRWAPSWAYAAAGRFAVARMLGAAVTVRCPLVSVSQLIRQHSLGAVDLLKVDVERAELQVLRGVEDQHWPLVQQAALEVHAADLGEVLRILRSEAGFTRVVVEQEAALAGTSLHAVHCTRH